MSTKEVDTQPLAMNQSHETERLYQRSVEPSKRQSESGIEELISSIDNH